MPVPGPERHRPSLLLVARALLAGQQLLDKDASDLVQDTLLEAHRDAASFTGQGDAEQFAWLRKILLHNFLDACAKARAAKYDVSRRTFEADLTGSFAGLDELLVAPDSTPSERAARNEELARLADALERLDSEAQRQALTLRHFAGLSLGEVAKRMNLAPTAVAGLLYRGRQRLTELLKERT
jgi:RNA polymerase sigma-70 factor (ECF subfamily)